MKRPLVLLTAVIAILTSCTSETPEYQRIHQAATVADMHCDGVLRISKGRDFSIRNSEGHMDIPRLIEGGTDLQVFACWLDTETPTDSCRLKVDRLLDVLDSVIADSDQLDLCTTADEAESIINEGRIAAFLGIENGVAIAGNLDNLQHYYDRGLRYMTLTHTASSEWCISSADTAPACHGLTDFGRDVVRKMNELGMIIDISHASVAAVDEVLKVTTAPVIASHSCVYALSDHDRNLTDEQIEAIAANGGLIGINYFNEYLSQAYKNMGDSLWELCKDEYNALKERYKDDDSARSAALGPIKDWYYKELEAVPVNVGTVVDHFDYIIDLVGPDNVGLGSDWDGVPSMPEGLTDCSMVPNLTKEMLARGYSEEDIGKILGGNFMRVFRQVCGGT